MFWLMDHNNEADIVVKHPEPFKNTFFYLVKKNVCDDQLKINLQDLISQAIMPPHICYFRLEMILHIFSYAY